MFEYKCMYIKSIDDNDNDNDNDNDMYLCLFLYIYHRSLMKYMVKNAARQKVSLGETYLNATLLIKIDNHIKVTYLKR